MYLICEKCGIYFAKGHKEPVWVFIKKIWFLTYQAFLRDLKLLKKNYLCAGGIMWALLNVTWCRHAFIRGCMPHWRGLPHWTWTPSGPPQSSYASPPSPDLIELYPWLCPGVHTDSLTYITELMKTISVVLWTIFSLSKWKFRFLPD